MRQVIGIHSTMEVLKVRPRSIKRLVFRQGYEESKDLQVIAREASRYNLKLEKQNVGFLDRIGSGHQGVMLEVSETPTLDWKSLRSSSQSLLLALDGLEDPNNLGSILRSAWLFGVSGILTPANRAVGLTPTVQKVASGGAEHVPIDIHPNLLNPLKDLKDLGFWVFGLSGESTKSLWDLKISKKVIWVTGSEESGIKAPIKGICDEMISIPQIENGPSFNAGVATAIAIAETRRQWFENKQ